MYLEIIYHKWIWVGSITPTQDHPGFQWQMKVYKANVSCHPGGLPWIPHPGSRGNVDLWEFKSFPMFDGDVS